MKVDQRKEEEEEKWGDKSNNREQWKRITKISIKI